jgi:hypothetical protein
VLRRSAFHFETSAEGEDKKTFILRQNGNEGIHESPPPGGILASSFSLTEKPTGQANRDEHR